MDPDTATAPIRLDDAADRADEILFQHRRGVVTTVEAASALASAVEQFARSGDRSAEDLQLLVDYVLDCGARLTLDRPNPDRGLLVWLNQLVSHIFQAPALRAELGDLLGCIGLGVRFDDPESVAELERLCSEGLRTHGHLLAVLGATEMVLDTAYDLGQARALFGAVGPSNPWRIAPHSRRRSACIRALDQLAHLAATPHDDEDDDPASEARACLIELVGFFEVAGLAAVRLPTHLLSGAEVLELSNRHEARVEVLTSDPVLVPLDLDTCRDNEIVRDALWHAIDAGRL
jgi:hypothetical protein